jgi:hypothetical protein
MLEDLEVRNRPSAKAAASRELTRAMPAARLGVIVPRGEV